MGFAALNPSYASLALRLEISSATRPEFLVAYLGSGVWASRGQAIKWQARLIGGAQAGDAVLFPDDGLGGPAQTRTSADDAIDPIALLKDRGPPAIRSALRLKFPFKKMLQQDCQ